ncbi:MAG: papain-like cysteine protease family protein [Bacillota bacterium]|nr:papain-like cysteine protease family protein [Bacillota bacterium]
MKKNRKRHHSLRKKRFRIVLFLAALCVFLWVVVPKIGFISPGIAIGDRDIPLLLQTDVRWANEPYGDDTVSKSGCGPTCIAMVAQGLCGSDTAPDEVAAYSEDNGYFDAGSGTRWTLMTEGVAAFGLRGRELPLDEGSIRNALNGGTPIIASVKPGDFTDKGHFIVFAGLAKNGEVIVNDPNSKSRSERTWPLDRLIPQIKNLWCFSPT